MIGDHLVYAYVFFLYCSYFVILIHFTDYNPMPVAPYPKSSLRREYVRREEVPPPRSRPVAEYSSRGPSDRRMPYRDDYSSRGSGYPDLSRGPSRAAPRRDYVDDGYGQRYERPPPAYREARGREYDSLSGSKRPYATMVSKSLLAVLQLICWFLYLLSIFIRH